MTTHELGEFEGKREVASELKITKTGDGLSKPLAAEPRAWTSGTKLPVLLWVEIGKIIHDPVDKGDGWVRVHDAPVVEGAVLDRVDVGVLDELMATQREAVKVWEEEQLRAKEEAKGITRVPFPEAGDLDGAIDVDEVEPEGLPPLPERPEGMSEEEWEASARVSSVSPIGSKRRTRARS